MDGWEKLDIMVGNRISIVVFLLPCLGAFCDYIDIPIIPFHFFVTCSIIY